MFHPTAYIVVFAICVILLATVRSRIARQTILLAASIGLYLTWVPWFTVVLLTSAAMNYMVGLWLRGKRAGRGVIVGIFLNLALLGVFKYLPEMAEHVPLPALHPFVAFALPLGISFWTFQALSYLFDLYQGEELDPSFTEFLLYTAFFPVTISGPVCRLTEMLPQFRSEETTAGRDIREGFRRIAIGVLMVEVAKLLGQGILAGDGIVSGFDRSTSWSGADVWCLSFGYGLQLFFDFAGYSHIAIGAARAMGFTIPENFSQPFASTTPSIFWTRWHMSLSFWIRDYIFFPLMQMRRETSWRNLSLLFSMMLFGLWHKASLLFLLWGCYHGILLVLHRQLEQIEYKFNWKRSRVWTLPSWFATSTLISLGWILFRAGSLSQAAQMLSAVFIPTSYFSHALSSSLYVLVAGLAGGYGIAQLVTDMLDRRAAPDASATPLRSGTIALLSRWRWFWIPSLYALALLFVLLITHGQEAGAGQLMYRRF